MALLREIYGAGAEKVRASWLRRPAESCQLPAARQLARVGAWRPAGAWRSRPSGRAPPPPPRPQVKVETRPWQIEVSAALDHWRRQELLLGPAPRGRLRCAAPRRGTCSSHPVPQRCRSVLCPAARRTRPSAQHSLRFSEPAAPPPPQPPTPTHPHKLAALQLPSRKLEVELTTVSSNYHVELNPSDVGNNDRYVVQVRARWSPPRLRPEGEGGRGKWRGKVGHRCRRPAQLGGDS
jgi:hypothetical protein